MRSRCHLPKPELRRRGRSIAAAAGGQRLPVNRVLSGTATGCSATVTPPPPGQFLRGDANESGELNVADVITMLDYLFGTGTSAPCLDAFDVNDSGVVNIADPIGLLGYLFAAEAPPAPPFPTVGTDPTADSLAPCP